MAAGANGRGLVRRVAELLLPSRNGRVREMIGRWVAGSVELFKNRFHVKSVDQTIPNYEYWDKLRRGKLPGYTLGGLFAKRIESIFATWVLGRGVEISLHSSVEVGDDQREHTNSRLAQFVDGLFDTGEEDDEADPDRDDDTGSLVMNLYKDTLGLGDQYVIVNPDGSISVPGPDTVKVERHQLDYRRIVAVQVETRLDDVTVIDRYEPDARTVTLKEGGQVRDQQTFENLIGRIPVVHLAHERSGNETNGHPIHEQLLPLYDQYDDTVFKQLDGAKLLGNPLLAFVGLKDLEQVINANDPAEDDTYTDKDGNTATRNQLNIDRNAVLLVGEGGDAKFVAPPTGFTEDTKNALKSLFLLLLDHTGIPEFIWGNEISSGRSSTETQMKQWTHDIEGRQRDNGGWLVRLCKIWLQYQVLTDPQIVVGKLTIDWPPLIEEDQDIQLKRIGFGKSQHLLTDETALSLLHLVDDPAAEVEQARAEFDERQAALFPEGDTAAFQGRLTEGDEEEDE